MRKITLVYLLAICCLVSCGKQNEVVSEQSNEPFDVKVAKDYFEHKVVPQLARHFTVDYHGNYKVVKTNVTFYPRESGVEGRHREDVMVLVQKGTSPPSLTGALADAAVIYIPVETIALNEHHAECFLRELGLEDHINAIGGLYSYNTEMREKAISDEVGQIGYSWHGPPNVEVLLDRKPEVFVNTLGSLDHNASYEKCRKLGIPTAAAFDWAEEEYLGRAEWIKYYSLFFNAEREANRVFQEMQQRIETLKALVENVAEKPSAIWGFYTSKQRWHMQLTSYSGQYMRDAGLENILLPDTPPNANGAQTLTTEELLLKGKEAEHWIIGDIHGSPLPKEKLMSSFKAWRTGKLYHNMKRANLKANTSDWDAQAIVRPDSVVADLIKLVHPDLLPGYKPVFLGHFDHAD